MDANAQMELMEQHLLFHKAMAEDEESFKRINGYLEVLHEENTGEQLSDSVDESIRSVFSLVLEKGMDPWAINLEEFARLYSEKVSSNRFDMLVAGRLLLMAWKILNLQSQETRMTAEPPAEEEVVDLADFDFDQQGGNVGVCAVKGNFDDAQTGVKQIFGDAALADSLSSRGWFLSSANSINWGRLLPQIVYYISAYCDEVNAGRISLGDEINFVVPTGNFGNILAGWYAKQMGLPVRRFVCASNENNILTDFISTGIYDKNRPFHITASPSMDILVSSNLERLLFMLSGSAEETACRMRSLREEGRYQVSDALLAKLQREFSCGFCDDDRTRAAIGGVWAEHQYLMDTHTAVAYQVLRDYRLQSGDRTHAVVVSTASPFKFCDHVLRAIGGKADAPGVQLLDRLSDLTEIPVPPPLSGLAHRPVRFESVVGKNEMAETVRDFLA